MYNLILPTYNEKENIETMLELITKTFKELDKPYKIIVVDDNSPDGTGNIVKSLKIENLVLIPRNKKSGLGSAYKSALDECEYDYTIVMDADLSHDPAYIKDMAIIMEADSSDIVSSTRYASTGGVYGWSLLRKIISQGANTLAKVILGLETSDLTGSFRMYKTKVFKNIMSKSKATGYSFQMELICLAEREEYKISECPIVFHERTRGSSKLGIMEIVGFLKTTGMLLLRL